MSSITLVPPLTYSAMAGIRRDTDRMAGVASRVSRLGTGPSADRVQGDTDSVELSGAARALGSGAPPDTSAVGTAMALTDQRVAKYSAVANLRVLSTADQVASSTLAMIGQKA